MVTQEKLEKVSFFLLLPQARHTPRQCKEPLPPPPPQCLLPRRPGLQQGPPVSRRNRRPTPGVPPIRPTSSLARSPLGLGRLAPPPCPSSPPRPAYRRCPRASR